MCRGCRDIEALPTRFTASARATPAASFSFYELSRQAGYQLGLPSLFEERRKDFIAARFHGQATGHYHRLEGLLAETVEPRESVELTTQREQRWAASLVERAEEAQEFLEGPPSGAGWNWEGSRANRWRSAGSLDVAVCRGGVGYFRS